MKKILFFLLFVPGIIFSQSAAEKRKIVGQTNTKALKELSKKYKSAFQNNKELAWKLAKLNGWQTTISKGNSFSELVGVSNNHPIYYTTYNEGAGITSRANKLYTGGGLGLNVQGENMLSAMWDAASGLSNHELFNGRLQIMDDCIESRTHATHVGGTIIGTDQVQAGHARGMAFKSNLHSYDWNNDAAEMATAAANGLLLSNHSYGYNAFAIQDYQWGKYDLKSAEYDQIMFNAPYFQFVCAAGNSRGAFNLSKNGYDLITGQGASKNGITVAAVEEVLDYTGPTSVVMSNTSSWGPTDDGRIKPDISAKGVNTFSATSESSQSYGFASGTSMAAPSVTGTLLLIQQYHNQRQDTYMQASTLKGLMIHTADEAGPNPGPDYSFGWGLINAEKAANIITKKDLQSYILENTLAQNGTFSIPVKAVGNEPLVATLCWTDPQGQIHSFNIDDNTPELINDLDIRITQLGETFYPWKLNPANPSAAATIGDNLVDNVEKAEVANPVGDYVVTVSHKGNLQNNSQKYSLIISGIVIKDFWFVGEENTKSVCHPTNEVAYSFAMHLKEDFNEDITLSAYALPDGVTASFTPQTMNANGNFTMTLHNINTLEPSSYIFFVKGQSVSDAFEITLVLNVLSSNFSEITLQQPANNETGVVNPVALRWEADGNAQQYDIQIATDSNFTNLIESATTTNYFYTSTLLNNDNTYYWRVRSKNQCGNGTYCSPHTFKTACILPSNLTLQNIDKNSATIGWTSNSDSWTYKLVLHDGNPSGSGTVTTSNPITLNNLVPNTCYDFYFKNTCVTGGPFWSEPFTFCTTPDYCNGDHFYDSGGAGGNYQNNEDRTIVIYPENAGERVRAVFNSFQLDNCCDYLIIFNGPNDTSPFVLLANGDNTPGSVVSTDVSGALTFVFHSNGNAHAAGWDATITCEPLPACPNPPTEIEVSNTSLHSATLEWQDNSASSSWEIEVVPHNTMPTGTATGTASSNPFTVNSLAQNKCYDFYVRSICPGGTSGWTGPKMFCTKSEYCDGDHFYDNGGPTANYQNYEYKTTVIAPENSGDRVKAIFNSYNVENCCDSFIVYNGPNSGYPVLYDNLNNPNPPTTLASTHSSGKLTFVFAADGFHNFSGWDARIVCESMPNCATFPDDIEAEDITTTSANIQWDDNCNPASWEIEIVTHGDTPTGVGIPVNDNNHAYSNLLSNTCYDIYIRSICPTGNSIWSPAYTFCTEANYCAGDHFYDSGGVNGNYYNDEFKTTVIYPDEPGNRVKVVFNSFNVENCCDRLKIYNGPTRNHPLLHNSSNGIPTTYVSTHSSGALTFVFSSNGQNTQSGWDATITCEALPACANLPNNIRTVATSSQTAKMDWNENSGATSWEVKYALHNATPTASGTVITNNSYLFTGLNADTCYDFYVRSICSEGASEWTQPFMFCTEPNYCSGPHFYDSGGANGNYQNNQDKITIIYPGNTGERVRAIFNAYEFESCCDYLKIYNGPDITSPLLYNDAALSPGSVASTDVSGALTFEFHSDGSSNAIGWDALILCENFPTCPNPPSAIKATDITTTGAVINWTENGSATSWEIEIVNSGVSPSGNGTIVTANAFTTNSLTSNICYDFYVRSICTNGTTGWSGPLKFCTLPDYCGGDHFYDSGGPSGNYENSEHTTTVIYPNQVGDKVSANFVSFILEGCCDYMRIYNGPNNACQLLYNGGFVSPGLVSSTDPSGALTFEFFSDGNSNAQGWDAVIDCAPLTTNNPQAFEALEYYPNPVSRIININAHEKVKKYTIYDVSGKLLWESKINQERFEIDMQHLSAGNYFIKLTNDSGAITRTIKVLKK